MLTILNGETALQRRIRGASATHLWVLPNVALRYLATLATLTALYYGLHALAAARLR